MRNELETKRSARSPLAQSRIDYIVFGNPGPVRKLLFGYGYEPPGPLTALSGAVHELIRKEGKKVVVDLVKLHPDRDAILSASKEPLEKPEVKIEAIKEAEQKIQTEVKKENTGCVSCGKNHKKEDSYCGCSHAYDSFDPTATFEKLKSLDVSELLRRYETLSKEATTKPENRQLADEVMMIWNEIRRRNSDAMAEKPKQQEKQEKPPCLALSYREGLLILGLTVVAGILIGVSVRAMTRQSH